MREQHVDHQVAEGRGLALPEAVDVVLVFVAHQLELVVLLEDLEGRDDLVGAAEGDGVAEDVDHAENLRDKGDST